MDFLYNDYKFIEIASIKGKHNGSFEQSTDSKLL
jgi:hypothetical protein